MDQAVLVEQKIQAGKRLIDRLDAEGLKIVAALWLLDPESRVWRLLLASPYVGTSGPTWFYKKTRDALQALGKDAGLTLRDIEAHAPKDSEIQLFRGLDSVDDGAEGVRLTGNLINSTFVEDAYIYRVPPDKASAGSSGPGERRRRGVRTAVGSVRSH